MLTRFSARAAISHPIISALLTSALFIVAPHALAADFTIIDDGVPVTAQQTLNAGETGTIDAGGQLNTTNNAILNPNGQDGVTVLNNGAITTDTTADKERGIWSKGDDVSIINNGSISTSSTAGNTKAHGIESSGDNASILNSGSISATANKSHGIRSEGDNANIINSGSISTTGSGKSHAIRVSGDNSNVTNSGSIRVTGGGVGIRINNTTGPTTITNSGLISATGASTEAIRGDGSDQTLNLLSGSQIIGSIDLRGGTDVVNISGANTSSTLTILNAETFNLNVPGLVNGNIVTTVDPTGQSVNGAVLSILTAGLHGVISQRQTQNKPLKPVQLASLKLSPGMLFQEREPQAWGQVFGSHRSRDTENNVLGYDHDYAGFTGGYEYDRSDYRVGLMGGYARSEVETDLASIDTNTDSYYIGVYAHHNLGSINVTSSLIAGYEDHDNERTVVDNINGIEVAQADIDSYFISPSVTISAAYTLNNKMELRPSASLAYSVARYDSYNESGTTRSNLSIDNRTVKALTGQLQLALGYQANPHSELEVRVGITTRHTDDDDIDASLAGTNFSIAASSDDSVNGGYVGINYRRAIKDNMNLLIDVEYGEASGNEYHGSASLSFEMLF